MEAMPLPIAIVAHPDRREMAEKLAAEVDGQPYYDEKRPPTEYDHAVGCAATHLAVLRAALAGPRSPWLCVLEDDAIPVPNFREHVDRALTYAPAPIVSFYLGTGNATGETQQQIRAAVRRAQAAPDPKAWITADCLIGSVGYAISWGFLADIITYISGREEELPLRLSRWAQYRNATICYTQPSLVEHHDGDTVGHPWRGPYFPERRAWWYGTRDDWDTAAVTLGHCPTWSAPLIAE